MRDSVRVLAVTNLYPSPLLPNLGTFNRQQIRALSQLHPVEVIAPVLWTDEVRARVRTGRGLPRGRVCMVDGVRVEHPRYLYPPKVSRHWYGSCYRWSVGPAFRRAVARFRPDVVLAAWAYPDGWAVEQLAHRAGLPVVVKVHGSDVLELPDFPDRRARTAEALRRADGVVAVSRHLAGRIAEMGVDPQRIRVVYDGVDSCVFGPGPRDAARQELGLPAHKVIVCVANLYPVKGHAVLLAACARLAARGVDFSCHLIGAGPLESELRAEVARLGLSDRVRLNGEVDHGRLPAWYRAADVFVLASHSEGVPCVLLEALACHTPYVATAVGGIPEIAHGGLGRTVPPGNPERLADALHACLADPPRVPFGERLVRGHDSAALALAAFLRETRDRRIHEPASVD